MAIVDIVHAIVDYFLSWIHLVSKLPAFQKEMNYIYNFRFKIPSTDRCP